VPTNTSWRARVHVTRFGGTAHPQNKRKTTCLRHLETVFRQVTELISQVKQRVEKRQCMESSPTVQKALHTRRAREKPSVCATWKSKDVVHAGALFAFTLKYRNPAIAKP
jgi:hypothetical protein